MSDCEQTFSQKLKKQMSQEKCIKSYFKEAAAKYIVTDKVFWKYVKSSQPAKVTINKITHVN